MKVDDDKFIKRRNALIMEIVEEMGEEKAKRYFSLEANRKAIEDIARSQVFWQPTRDLSIEKFREGKWKKVRDPEIA